MNKYTSQVSARRDPPPTPTTIILEMPLAIASALKEVVGSIASPKNDARQMMDAIWDALGAADVELPKDNLFAGDLFTVAGEE